MPGVWGQGPSDAIRAPPPPTPKPSQGGTAGGRGSNPKGGRGQSNSNANGGTGRGAGTGRGGGGTGRGGRDNNQHGRGRGGRNNNNHTGRGGAPNKQTQQQQQQQQQHNPQQHSVSNVTLLHPGDGETPAQRQVLRYSVEHMLELRHLYVNPLPTFAAPEMLHWLSEERLDIIASRAPRQTGDVSKPRRIVKDTAPALEDCKPLEVNDTTRWKAKVFQGMENVAKDETDDDVLKQALLILNKLSLTTFDKLSDAFVNTGIGRSTECLTGAIKLILEKAQSEPHFANMYAMLCLKLSKTEFDGNKKTFKKLLLTQCQQEFEQDVASKLANISDSEEQAYEAGLIKKKYLGHMRFIGELYKGDMIKIDIMLWCLTTLLDDVSEEEKVECFCKLMSTIGFSLEQQSAAFMQVGKAKPAEDLANCWKTVYDMSLSAQVTPRLKFMLLDLMEMRDKGWVTRRKEETAKTIDQIHEEVAKEEAKAARRSSSKRSLLSQRSGSLKPIVDDDGFVHIVPRATSFSNLSRSVSESAVPAVPKPGMGRSQSFSVAPPKKEAPKKPSKKFLDVKDVETKTKNLLKEYFISGETDDAVMTVNDLVGVGHVGAIDRGAKVVEAGCLLVMEMKEEHVAKMMVLFSRCLSEGTLEKECLIKGLMDPLEFLHDIEIDAPLARPLLATIVAGFLTADALTLDFLLSGPEYFLSSGKPARFAAKVVKKIGGEVLASNVFVVDQLMTAKEKDEFHTATAFIESI